MDAQVSTQKYDYNAFLSYSHASDGALTPIIQRALHQFAKPWYRPYPPALRVFRDQTNLSATPHLWSTIQTALDRADYFILVSSPESAQSRWVNQEADHWVKTRGGMDKLLIVLIRGTIVWDEKERDFDWSKTDAVPRTLSKASTDEPLYVDLREVLQHDPKPTMGDPGFYDAIVTLAATLHGKSKDEIAGEDLRQSRQFKRARRIIIALIAGLFAVLVTVGIQSIRDSREAQRQSHVAERWAALRLFATSLMLTDQVEGTKNFSTLYSEPSTASGGLMFGIRPWSQRAGTLVEILRAFDKRDHGEFVKVFGDGDEKLASDLIEFTAKRRGGLDEPDARFDLKDNSWLAKFRSATHTPIFLEVQKEIAVAAFRRDLAVLRKEAPEITSERGVALALDIRTFEGPGALRQIIRDVRKPGMSQQDLLDAMETESIRRISQRIPAFARAVTTRRRLFATTPLLENRPVSGRLTETPAWYTDVADWTLEKLGLKEPEQD